MTDDKAAFESILRIEAGIDRLLHASERQAIALERIADLLTRAAAEAGHAVDDPVVRTYTEAHARHHSGA